MREKVNSSETASTKDISAFRNARNFLRKANQLCKKQ